MTGAAGVIILLFPSHCDYFIWKHIKVRLISTFLYLLTLVEKANFTKACFLLYEFALFFNDFLMSSHL